MQLSPTISFAGCRFASLVFLVLFYASQVFAFNSDGKTDIVWRNTATDENVFWWMNEVRWSGGNLLEPVEKRTTARMNSVCGSECWRIVGSADFDRDGYVDLLWRDSESGRNRIWLMSAANKQAEVLIQNGDVEYYVAGTGDFNSDGYVDILWRSDAQDRTLVWLMKGTQVDTSVRLEPSGAGKTWRAAAVGDFDNDGYPDILWQNAELRRLAIWYMRDLQQVSSKTLMRDGSLLYPAEPGWMAVATGIFNQVGNTDILWRRTTGDVAIWLMRNDVLERSLQLPSMPYPEWQIGGTGGYLTYFQDHLATHGRQLAATIRDSRVTLQWRFGDAAPPSIYRRLSGATNWGEPVATNVLPYRWTDPTPAPASGARVEYRLSSRPGSGEMIVTSLNGPPVHERGTVFLVVEKSIAAGISKELELLRSNLIGEGWKVRRVTPDVDRHDDNDWSVNKSRVVAVKAAITNLYAVHPDAKVVLLIGHVPIPHSGALNLNPDGHGARSLPADGYYGDVDGLWTDESMDGPCALGCNSFDCSCGPCAGARHANHPGDGVWDQSLLPPNTNGVSEVELAVGRIDFGNMTESLQPLFPGRNYEVEALRRYLNKTDRYRRKLFTLRERVMLGTYFKRGEQWQQQLVSGLRIGSRLFGFAPGRLNHGDGFFPENACTWAVNAGFGMAHHIAGSNFVFHATWSNNDPSDVSFLAPGAEPQAGFFSLLGSCFADFAYPNNLLRGILAAGTNYNLGAMYFPQGIPLRFERIALGDTVGSDFVRTFNETRLVYLAWLGDPTLRLQVLAPPARAESERTRRGITVRWNPSPDASNYFIYRSTNGLDGPWIRLTTGIRSRRFSDRNARETPGILYQYQVRAAALASTASGSYTNLSLGVFTKPMR